MANQETIQKFFEEQFKNTSRFFLYKDKQLLKKEEYQKFAEEQLKKASRIFWSVAFSILLFSWYGITTLIEYGSSPNWYDLIFGLSCWFGMIAFLIYSTKEYYTIKSSMNLLIKLLGKKNSKSNAAT